MTIHAHINQDNLNSIDQDLATNSTVEHSKLGVGATVTSGETVLLRNTDSTVTVLKIVKDNAASFAAALRVESNATVSAINSQHTGVGAIIGHAFTSTASTSDCVRVFNDGSGNSVKILKSNATTSGTCLDLETINTSNSDTTLKVKTAGTGAAATFEGGSVGVGVTTPAASLLLDLVSTTQSFGPPSMTTTQRNAISSPLDRSLIYNSTTNSLNLRAASNWVAVSTTSVIKTQYFKLEITNNLSDGFDVARISTSGVFNASFIVPDDFTSLTSLLLIGYPDSGAAGASKDIDLTSNYGGNGQSKTTHNETDTSSTFNLGSENVFFELDMSSVFSSLAAGDRCGLRIQHNTVGGNVDYIRLELQYE